MADRAPGLAIPDGQVVGPDPVAGLIEASADVQPVVPNHQRVDRPVDAIAARGLQRLPGAAVPARHVVGGDSADHPEIAAGVQHALVHDQGMDVAGAAHAAADAAEGVVEAAPVGDPTRRQAAGTGRALEFAGDHQSAGRHRQGMDGAVQARAVGAGERGPAAAVPRRQVHGLDVLADIGAREAPADIEDAVGAGQGQHGVVDAVALAMTERRQAPAVPPGQAEGGRALVVEQGAEAAADIDLGADPGQRPHRAVDAVPVGVAERQPLVAVPHRQAGGADLGTEVGATEGAAHQQPVRARQQGVDGSIHAVAGTVAHRLPGDAVPTGDAVCADGGAHVGLGEVAAGVEPALVPGQRQHRPVEALALPPAERRPGGAVPARDVGRHHRRADIDLAEAAADVQHALLEGERVDLAIDALAGARAERVPAVDPGIEAHDRGGADVAAGGEGTPK